MPDRELPDQLMQRLSAALESGAPLVSPLPAQARFASGAARMPAPRWRLRGLAVAVAVTGVVAVALAGPAEAREGIVKFVGDIAHQVGVPTGSSSPASSSPGAAIQRESAKPNTTPGATRSPGSTEAAESPAPAQSQSPAPSPENEAPAPSPTAEPSDGGGDSSSEPSPSSSDSGQ